MDDEVDLTPRGIKGRPQVKRERADRMIAALVIEAEKINADPLPSLGAISQRSRCSVTWTLLLEQRHAGDRILTDLREHGRVFYPIALLPRPSRAISSVSSIGHACMS